MDQMLSPRFAGHEIGRTTETVREYIKRGMLRAVRVGNAYRIPRAELDRFLEQNRVIVERDEDSGALATGG